MLREAAMVSGYTALAVNKLDVLSGTGEIQIATAYRIDGKVTEEFPMTLGEIERAEPIYETHAGWSEDLTGCRRFADLPRGRARYVERVEALVGVPVELISVGPEPRRDDRAQRSVRRLSNPRRSVRSGRLASFRVQRWKRSPPPKSCSRSR